MSDLFPSEEELRRMQEHLDKSANMIFYTQVLPSMIQGYHGSYFYYGFGDEVAVRSIINALAHHLEQKGNLEGIEHIRNAKIHFRLDVTRQLRATILELEGASVEPECNLLAIVYYHEEDGSKKVRYLTSELYYDGSFGLCEMSGGKHLNYGSKYGNIVSVDDMWDAIKKVIPEVKIHPKARLTWHYDAVHHVTTLVDVRLDDPSTIEKRIKAYELDLMLYTDDHGVEFYRLCSKEGVGFLLFRAGEDTDFLSATLEDRDFAISLGNAYGKSVDA